MLSTFGSIQIVIIIVLSSSIQTVITKDILLNLDEYKEITSLNYPNNYPSGDQEWEVIPGGGTGIEVHIDDLDLNSIKGDALYLKPGGKDSVDSVKIFTWKIIKPRKYVIIHSDSLYIKFKAASVENKNKGFKIRMKRLDELITTTVPPITDPPPLRLEPLEESYLYLKGMTLSEFTKVNETFKRELAGIADNYCIKNNITIEENVTIYDNVNMEAMRCNIEWLESEKCVEIRYSIPVNSFNITHGYELSNVSLDKMWEEFSKNPIFEDSSLKNLTVYNPPDTVAVMMSWIWICIGVIIAFSIALYINWKYGCFNEFVSAVFIDEDGEPRKSDASFFPIPNQVVPPLYGYETYGSDEKSWDDLPPAYTENANDKIDGKTNFAFDRDDDIFNADDDIIMSLEDTLEHKANMLRESIDTLKSESNL